MTIKLIQLSSDDGEDVFDMLQHIEPGDHGFKNEAYGMSYEEYKSWLIKLDAWSRGEDLPEGYVVQHTYWLVVDGRPVGYGKIREKLTEQSRIFGGNIGYAIDSRERGKGYGTRLMSLLIEKAKELGIEERLLTVEKYNYASKAVIEKCGARIIKETNERWYFTI